MDRATRIKLVERTRELIARPYGWTRGVFQRDSKTRGYPAYCLGGAFQAAANDLKLDNVASRNIHSTEIAGKVLGIDVITFNDHEKRRKREVIALLDEYLAGLREVEDLATPKQASKVPPKG